MRRSVIAVLCALLALLLIPGPAAATYYGNMNVPGAKVVTSGGDNGAVPGAVNVADYIHASETATLGGIPLPPGYGYATQWIITRDFTAGVWNNEFHIGGRDIGLPADTATISLVYFDIRWQPPHVPDHKVGVSFNGGTSWTWGAFQSAHTIISNEWRAENITGFTAWTPQIVKSPNLCVKIISYSYGMVPAVYCQLDYLGIYVLWSGPDPEIYTPAVNDETPEDPVGGIFDFNIVGGEAFMSILGTAGFIGMVATPAALVYSWKKGDPKLESLINMMGLFVSCFGFWYISTA